ncbi:hypothetical protein J7E81_15570 [Bacillus sp. ISL-18]|uniref:hypothetical protein n=1 Tax=Bacillus sp. ISL-18 TaxID=2819118 RepID=UPI001BE61253|nr:hypothetical protein [Bacillus sp. ISL-18]MBT2656638.1 hypothetical protein [Bacillus sp. ISL-18]
METMMNEAMVNLEEAYKVGMAKKKPSIKNFLRECVKDNKEEIIRALTNMKQFDSIFIMETFAFQILGGMFSEKEKEELIDIIKSGSLFKIKDQLIDAFYNDQDINKLLI